MTDTNGRVSPIPSLDDHTSPPPPLPPKELGPYTVGRDPDRERDIARYVESQARDETVEHVELVKTEIILGQKYEVWDVLTDKERWWVITELTNLYPQRLFPTLDYTLSLHVGLMMRLRSREGGAEAAEPSPFDEVFRRQEQAEALADNAVEVHDFQAVGMQLRECLLSLLPAMRRRVTIPADVAQPQEANFKEWYNVLMDVLCAGGSNKDLRTYLKHTAKETWDLVNWLTHDRKANKTAADVAIQATGTVVGHSMQILGRERVDLTNECPVCKSRNVREHYDPFLGDTGDYYYTCGSCRWSSHEGYEDDDEDA